MGVLTTTTEITSALTEYYDRNLLERAVDENLHDMFGQVRPMKSKMGKTIKFRRYEALGSTPDNYTLTEGVTPDGEQLSKTDVTATIVQYGNYVTLTDVMDYTNPDPVLTEAGKILGEQCGEVRDLIIRDVLAAGSGVVYENTTQSGANRAAVSGPPELDGIKLIVRTLRGNNAKVIKEILRASVGINTAPVAPSYAAITHNMAANTYRAITGFLDIQEYSQPGNLMKQEFGGVWDTRYCWSNNAKYYSGAGSGSIDVYTTLYFGQNAYGITALEQGTAKNIVKPLGSGGSSDPLDQRATSGWKLFMIAAILNNNFMYRYEHSAS